VKQRAEGLGVGIGYRHQLAAEIHANRDEIDFLEVITEQAFFPGRLAEFKRVAAEFPIVFHGVDMSLGTAEPLDPTYLQKLEERLRQLQPRWISDHLAMTRIQRRDRRHRRRQDQARAGSLRRALRAREHHLLFRAPGKPAA
jgi:uncharacterized protein (UPF0276 family)